jgi:hypothetical protein
MLNKVSKVLRKWRCYLMGKHTYPSGTRCADCNISAQYAFTRPGVGVLLTRPFLMAYRLYRYYYTRGWWTLTPKQQRSLSYRTWRALKLMAGYKGKASPTKTYAKLTDKERAAIVERVMENVRACRCGQHAS